jgi:hypothetical protein
MHDHLALLKNLKPMVEGRDTVPDMEIILSQALLMDAGGITFKAIKSGEIADILVGLVALAHSALLALAMQEQEIIEPTRESRQEYQMLAIMRILSEKIHHCSSGKAQDYCELYHLCASLASGFLNADFDKAFQVYHDWYKACQEPSHDVNKIDDQHKRTCPDLTDCLYE